MRSLPVSIPWGIVLFLILLTLKLAGLGDVAHWSWWAVCAPLLAWIVVTALVEGVREYRRGPRQ